MLPNIKRFCLFGLLLFSGTLTQGEEENTPLNNGWAARPSGNYEFLRFPYSSISNSGSSKKCWRILNPKSIGWKWKPMI